MQSTPLAEDFESHRRYLTAVAYRMLGSHADAEDAVQEAWLRVARATPDADDLRAWLTRVVSRICLDQLRSRTRRRESPLDVIPDAERAPDGDDPVVHAESADRVGYALMLVLEQLSPDERLAYVLHDVFGLSFDEVAPLVDRTAPAARKLASRARDRVRGAAPEDQLQAATREQRRRVVDAFLAAAKDGDFAGLLALLHPDVEFRQDLGADGVRILRGAEKVASSAAAYHRYAKGFDFDVVELGDGFAVVAIEDGMPVSLLFVTSEGDTIVAMETREIG
ncbi:RNA polymerase sigma factor (sigma-70 family) [Microbacterium natoriense]|uniref:RNA polymerase sigma factor (Sigma-70 family) n=1 Tax=Microbacterium natoriense TaxID=284570 RepID=A0AAW8EVA2_9MICO|nr:sigma-70 family RNA polymerase sigma factor [Microbacterium natoriense]MDQ0647022.1 RNA polymerase sigma factor (sigma-70 family) [Microbacterium natoriense]